MGTGEADSRDSDRLDPELGALDLPAGARVGRYQIVERLASGGMGVVFRAHDPHLSRQVALKLLLPSSLAASRTGEVDEYEQRLLREARVLASLSHPNVVAAFDVGKEQGRLFIAMALIEGVSLRTWLMRAPRSLAQIATALLEAGRGLSAAHRAGVVHRDFKLSNVMVSRGGHVQVVDFGLARTSAMAVSRDAGSDVRAPAAEPSVSPLAAADADLTRAGTVVGTVGYIAPEQFEGLPSDERSDQFSYASAAFRAFTSVSPYPTESLPGYRAALLAGEAAPWPRTIPRSIRRVIDRGLARDPAARYPSLEALLDDLERAIRPQRRPLLLIAAALALSVVALSVAARERFVDRCELDAHSFKRAWGSQQRAALERAFMASGNPRASDTFRSVDASLSEYERRWQHAKRDACLATHVQHSQSENILDLRHACLDRKLVQLGTLLSLLQRADPALVDRAREALDAIAQLRDCADVAQLAGESERMPDQAERRAQIRALLERLDALEAISAAGSWQAAVEQAEALARDAAQAEYRPVQARAMARGLHALERLGRRGEADVLRRSTLQIAAEAGALDVLAQLAVRSLLLAVDGARYQDASALLPLVNASVRLAGRPPELQIRLLTYEAAIESAERDYDAAIAKLELALAECQRLGQEGARSCLTPRRELGAVRADRGDYAAARVEFEAAVAIAKQAYGPNHPSLLNEYNNLGYVAASWGDLETAARALAESRALAATLPANRQTANIPFVEGVLRLRSGDLQGAQVTLEEALRQRSRAYGERTIQVAIVLNLLSVSLASAGRMSEAVAELERSLEIRQALGLDERLLVEQTYRLADAYWAVPARRAEALARARVVHALLKRAGPSWTEEARGVKSWLDTHEREQSPPER